MRPQEGAGAQVSRRFRLGLSALLGLALLQRSAYVMAQPATDPAFALPILDGAYYLDWARSLVAGEGGPPGAFYLAPLYPYLLAGFLRLFGERFGVLYLIQHALSLGTAAFLGLVAARRAGEVAGLATAGLAAFYGPTLFFASRPVGETVALFLLGAALWQAEREGALAGVAGGGLLGLAALGRPNWLPLSALWALGELRTRGGFRRAALVLGGAALLILPVAVRNHLRSGHLVAVSSNGGITFYHGNGAGAAGTYTAVPGVPSTVAPSDRFRADPHPDPEPEDRRTQREHATAEAIRISGRSMDAVEADEWWGRRALEIRMADPSGSFRLLLRRLWLTLDSTEHSLDYTPRLDANPWRTPRVPFAAIAGLALTGLVLFGFRGTGGFRVWSALLLCLVAPLVFYVSSRYRLPAALLSTIPAGIGLAGFFARGGASFPRRAIAASLGIGLALLSGSLAFPEDEVELAVGLNNRGFAHWRAGNLAAAERDFRDALALEPALADTEASLGSLLRSTGRPAEAIALLEEAAQRSPGSCRLVHTLAASLIEEQRPDQAIDALEAFLARRQDCREAWISLIVARSFSGDPQGALTAIEDARRARIEIPPGLVREVRALAEASGAAER